MTHASEEQNHCKHDNDSVTKKPKQTFGLDTITKLCEGYIIQLKLYTSLEVWYTKFNVSILIIHVRQRFLPQKKICVMYYVLQ